MIRALLILMAIVTSLTASGCKKDDTPLLPYPLSKVYRAGDPDVIYPPVQTRAKDQKTQ